MHEFFEQKGVPSIGSKTPCYPVTVNGHPYAVEGHDQIPDDSVALNGLQRRFAKLSIGQAVNISAIDPPAQPLSTLTFTVDTLAKKGLDPKRPLEVDTGRLAQTVLIILENQVLEKGQSIALDFEGTKFEIVVFRMQALDLGKKKKKKGEDAEAGQDVAIGQFLEPTQLTFSLAEGCRGLSLEGDNVADGGAGSAQSIFLNDFDFEKLGIGGLDSEFNQIFRRAFASRLWPPSVIKQMGINHVRGMLLYGPPGCGKTLIARQIGKALNAREPKIVNGPEILDKFVGGSEEKVRSIS